MDWEFVCPGTSGLVGPLVEEVLGRGCGARGLVLWTLRFALIRCSVLACGLSGGAVALRFFFNKS